MLRVSEIFYSLEGEGPLTGRPTVFVRFFGCNFTCSGFGQDHKNGVPAREGAHKLMYVEPDSWKDVASISFSKGCDSAYSWHPAFKHLASDYTPEELADEIIGVFNMSCVLPVNKPVLCFTGGEPMLWQNKFGKVLKLLNGFSDTLLIETNASIKPTDKFYEDLIEADMKVVWSNSPKLAISGEPRDKAIRPDVIDAQFGEKYFKFVTDGSEDTLKEILQVIKDYSGVREGAYNHYLSNTWLMPEGATLKQQHHIQKVVAQQCLKYGLSFCARVHVWIWGNKIGT